MITNIVFNRELRSRDGQIETLLSRGLVAVGVMRSESEQLQGAAQCASSHVHAGLFVSTYNMFMFR